MERIHFAENTGPFAAFSEPVVTLDPVCSLNNVVARITGTERQKIAEAAQEAWETANFASAENEKEVWKEIFAPRFKVEE